MTECIGSQDGEKDFDIVVVDGKQMSGCICVEGEVKALGRGLCTALFENGVIRPLLCLQGVGEWYSAGDMIHVDGEAQSHRRQVVERGQEAGPPLPCTPRVDLETIT